MSNGNEHGIYKICTAFGTGTGFACEGTEYLATNHHVVEGSTELAIEFDDKRRILGEVAFIDPAWDLALVRPKETLTGAKLGFSDGLPDVGAAVHVHGYPFGMPFSITQGVVSANQQDLSGLKYIQTDAAVNPGNSGGPMIDDQSKVIGVTTCKFEAADNMGFSLPVSHLKTDIDLYTSEGEGKYAAKCHSCESLLFTPEDYCDSCGVELAPGDLFPEENLSPLAEVVEAAFTKLGHNPVLTRSGYHFWRFFQGSAQIITRLYSREHMIVTSPVAKLPKKPKETLRYLLSYENPNYSFRLESDGTIYLGNEQHLSDIFNPSRREKIIKDISGLAMAADEVDNILIEKFGCLPSAKTNEAAL